MEELYRAAVYRVDGEKPFDMRVGQYSDALNLLFTEGNFRSAAFLTAYNPGGVKVSDTLNRQAQRKLDGQIALLRLPALPAMGLDSTPGSDWPGEQSTLVLGISRHDAVRLGVLFRQLAILWCPASAIPELLMLQVQNSAPGKL